MANKTSNMIIPEVINMFNVYNEGEKACGVTNEVSLAEWASKLATVEGAGIAGSYDVPVIGHFDSIKQTIPFKSLVLANVDFTNPQKYQLITLRGSMQVTDRTTNISDFMGMKLVIGGRAISFNPGTLKQGEAMNASVQIECTYIDWTIDGDNLIKLDKINGVYMVHGVDLMEKVRSQC